MAKSKVIVTLAASLLVLSLVFAASASAQTTRTVPGDCINPGAEFDVTISDAPGVGLIIEELCAGWTYKDSSLADYQVNVAGNVVTFTLVGDMSFTYTIEAPGAEDESCTIEGVYRDMDQNDHPIDDDAVHTCAGTSPTVARTVPGDCINPGAEFTVTINSPGVGVVTEELCAGWTYKDSSLADYQVNVAGNVVTFTLAGDMSFTYTIEAPGAEDESCTIEGVYRDMDQNDHPIDDDAVHTCAGTSPTVARTVPGDCINPGAEFTVTINSPGVGLIIEELCAGWTYKDSSLADYQVNVAGNVVTFTLAGDMSFTYTVEAPGAEDESCTIEGVYRDMDQNDHPIDDDSVYTCSSDARPSPRITAPADDSTVTGTVAITAVDDSGEDDIVRAVFECSTTQTSYTEICTDTDGSDGWGCSWDTTAVADDDYTIRVTMYDSADQNGKSAISVLVDNVADPDYELDLDAGLNLVSIPKTINGTNDAETVFNLDPYAGEFCVYYNAFTKSYDVNPDVKQCRGYWVFKNAAETVGVSFDTDAGAVSQQLYEGWNMVGHISLEAVPIYEEGSDSDFGSLTGLEEPEESKLYRQVCAYTQAGGWDYYPAGDLTEMTPGMGAWILVKQDVMMYGMP